LFQREKCDTLITGDTNAAGERELLRRGELPDLELLIVGHHGSADSTSAELLYRTAPDAAIISVGRNNPYGHPRQEILNRLERYGIAVFRTDLSGDIMFKE
jgi:competence protein ComEC